MVLHKNIYSQHYKNAEQEHHGWSCCGLVGNHKTMPKKLFDMMICTNVHSKFYVTIQVLIEFRDKHYYIWKKR